MYGKDYLDQRDAATARIKIEAAITEALKGIEDGYTRDRVRAEFTPGGNVQGINQLAYMRQMAEAQRPAPSGYYSPMTGQLARGPFGLW